MQRPLAGGSGVRGIASHIHPHFASELPHQQHLRRGVQGGDGANERAMLDARGSSTQSGHAWSPRWPRKRRRTGRVRKEGANAGRARAAVPRRPAVEQCAGACLLPEGELRPREERLQVQVRPGPGRKLGLPSSGSGAPRGRPRLGLAAHEDTGQNG